MGWKIRNWPYNHNTACRTPCFLEICRKRVCERGLAGLGEEGVGYHLGGPGDEGNHKQEEDEKKQYLQSCAPAESRPQLSWECKSSAI